MGWAWDRLQLIQGANVVGLKSITLDETYSFLGNHAAGRVLNSLNLTHSSTHRTQSGSPIPQLLGKMRHGCVLSSCLRSELVIVMEVTEGMVLGCLTWSQDLARALHTSALTHSLCCLKSEQSD